MMKQQSFHFSLIFLLSTFLLLSYSISARPLGKGAKEMKDGGIKEDFLNQLMGLDSEECEEKDEECLERRMIKEAHLDYIYTQHHKP